MFTQVRSHLLTLRRVRAILCVGLVFAGLFALSQQHFLIFHCLTEGFCVVIALATFVVLWNTRQYLKHGFFLILGLGGLSAGLLKLPYVFGYPGMGILVFPGADGNVALQSKLVAQWYLSLSCLGAFFFLRRKVHHTAALMVYGTTAAFVLASIFYWRVFPDCFVEGVGITPFDRIGLIVGSLAYPICLVWLLRKRHDFDAYLFQVMFAAGTGFFFEDITAALAADTTGSIKAIARLFQVAALYFVYQAFIEVGLKRPYDLLFRNLKQSEESLARSEAALKEAQRVAQLGSWEMTLTTGKVVWSEELYRIFGRDGTLPPPTYQEHEEILAPESLTLLRAAVEDAVQKGSPYEIDLEVIRPDGTRGWISARGKAYGDASGQIVKLFGTAHDITQRKRAEAALITFLLKKAGADVSVAENGHLAVEMMKTAEVEGRPFDLVLMDMQMPVMDGYEAAGRFRALGFTRPIVALTAHVMAGDREKCLDAGCDDYLCKPITAATLFEMVAKHAGRALPAGAREAS